MANTDRHEPQVYQLRVVLRGWYRCACEERSTHATYSALNAILTTHMAPELEFLQAKWSAHLSFAAVVDLLHDVLPVDPCLQVETVRRHVFATAERLEAELGPEQFAYDAGCHLEIEASPEPGPPITVGLDGGYIRGRERRPGATGCFEVIAGKSIPEEGGAKVFAGVRRVDTKPKRRLHEVLRSQGVLPRQHVTFLSDGGDTVRELPAYLHPHCEHILDWFHIGVRVEQLSQMARGFRGTYDCLIGKETILKELERVKWFLWHGNVFRADETLTELMFEVDSAIEEDREARRPAHLVLKKLARALEEFTTYIASGVVNYGERHRCGERISTGFVESTINQLVAKRFVKKQQMRWTPRRAFAAADPCQCAQQRSRRRVPTVAPRVWCRRGGQAGGLTPPGSGYSPKSIFVTAYLHRQGPAPDCFLVPLPAAEVLKQSGIQL